MTPEELRTLAIWPAWTLLPEQMRSTAAERMLIAIALQESDLRWRRQVRGPARGWWQFEVAGVRGVTSHRATRDYAQDAMVSLGYPGRPNIDLHEAIEHNDILAAAFARLNLWWLPQSLATTMEAGCEQYLEAWRPGAYWQGDETKRNHIRERWAKCWARASEAV